MDRHFFNFTGPQLRSLQVGTGEGGGDGEMLTWVNANAKPERQPWEIAAWSAYHEQRTAGQRRGKRSAILPDPWANSARRARHQHWFGLLDVDDHCTFGVLLNLPTDPAKSPSVSASLSGVRCSW